MSLCSVDTSLRSVVLSLCSVNQHKSVMAFQKISCNFARCFFVFFTLFIFPDPSIEIGVEVLSPMKIKCTF
jgi:hypothetical protein